MAKSFTIRTGVHVDIDLINGVVNFAPSSLLGQSDRKILIPRVGTAAQELIVVGGLEEWVKTKLFSNN
jgi:homoaconitate hydratase